MNFKIDDPELDRAYARLVELEPMRPQVSNVLHVNAQFDFSWWDRLKILFGAAVHVRSKTPVVFVERLGLRFGQTTSEKWIWRPRDRSAQ